MYTPLDVAAVKKEELPTKMETGQKWKIKLNLK